MVETAAMNSASSFAALAEIWQDDPATHEQVLLEFEAEVKAVPRLYEHRKWVEANSWGFGHDSFHRVWHLLAKELPDGFKYLEIGVYKGQAISAVDLAAQIEGKNCSVYGLSPFNGADGNYYVKRDNYEEDVEQLFARFNGSRRPLLIKGYSTDEKAKEAAYALSFFDAIYLDACHEGELPKLDIEFYAPLVKVGGYFLTDDSTTGFKVPSWFFQGFKDCSEAVNTYFNGNSKWKFLGNVMHMRIYQRVAY